MVIGITGKSGSGKSTIAQKIAKALPSARYYNLDDYFHTEIENHRDFILNKIGKEVFKDDSTIDRKKIGDIVFANRDLYKEYSEVLYAGVLARLDVLDYEDHFVHVVDHILLPHMPEIWSQCSIKILIEADTDIRYFRIKKRDAISDEYLELREAHSIEYNPKDFTCIIQNNSLAIEQLKPPFFVQLKG